MENIKVIGIDLGATNIRAATVGQGLASDIVSKRITSNGSMQVVLEDVFSVIDTLINEEIKAIGIGVPSVVDVDEGIVYDVQYIPSWKEVPLKRILQECYQIPVFVNNDANCFAAGEFYFGVLNGASSLVGLTIGTGLGAGIIVNKKLYAGYNCGAGEIGFFPYLDNILEYYCSGSFFTNLHGLDGMQVFKDAQSGDSTALQLYSELGAHIGNAIKYVMYSFDPEVIVLGGSVSSAFSFFESTMYDQLKTFPYQKSVERITIKPSSLQNGAILGAAALYHDSLTNKILP